MKKIEILVSTINQSNCQELIQRMNIKGNCTIINQITDTTLDVPKKSINQKVKFLSYQEKGLSKSRNRAIMSAEADICIIADDDMYYEEDIEEKIQKAYEQYPDADIIAFDVDNEDKAKRKKILSQGEVNLIKSMKISSVQITFKRKSILEKQIQFKENFGTGAEFNFGEENIFMAECLRKKLKIYYVPEKIATLMKDKESTWSREQTQEHYYIQGAVYYEMSKVLYPLLILQFVFRKKKIYGKTLKPSQVFCYMLQGVKKYKKDREKKFYYMGDFCSNTGPAIVNKSYYPYIKESAYICKTNSKLIRPLHYIVKQKKIDTLFISGLSKFHVKAAEIAKKQNKRVVYLMHGYSKMEYEINEIPKERRTMLACEEKLLHLSDKIICVSEKFRDFMKEERPEFSYKFDFVNNGIHTIEKSKEDIKKNRKEFVIISVGGGIKIKNNLDVCKAIERIKEIDIKFIVIGKPGKDGEKIKQYDFVEYYENLSHKEVLSLMQQSDLYIQNSYFETFGLAIIEAISQNCDILISGNVGVLSILKELEKENIIQNNTDIDEIQEKIQYLYENPNQIEKYRKELNQYTWRNQAKKLKEKICESEG